MFEINLPNGSVDSNNNIVVEGLDYDKLAELTEGKVKKNKNKNIIFFNWF